MTLIKQQKCLRYFRPSASLIMGLPLPPRDLSQPGRAGIEPNIISFSSFFKVERGVGMWLASAQQLAGKGGQPHETPRLDRKAVANRQSICSFVAIQSAFGVIPKAPFIRFQFNLNDQKRSESVKAYYEHSALDR